MGQFSVLADTIKRWFAEAVREPARNTVGSLVKAVPPLMQYSDVVLNLVMLMADTGFGGNRRIAATLARTGVKLSRETVRRYRKHPRVPGPKPETKSVARELRAERPNHVWMMDVTEIPGLFRLFKFKLMVVIDVFSRFPLAARLSFREPSASDAEALVRAAAHRFGAPKHFVSDRGSQFTSEAFREGLAALGVSHRFGAVGKTGWIAVIERFWRTMKDLLELPSRQPLTINELWQRIDTGLVYYAAQRPHQGLDGATPYEVYFGLRQAHINATRPRRAYEAARHGPDHDPLFEIEYIDCERLLPVLKRAA